MASYTIARANAATTTDDRLAGTFEQALAPSTVASQERPQEPLTVADTPSDVHDVKRPAVVREGHTEQKHDRDLLRQAQSRAATVTDSTTTSGVVIPGDFYAVDIRVVDPDGEPLKSVDWVMSAGVFPTAAKIDEEGFGTLWLLAVEYQAFMGVAERDDGNVDYTWYSRSEEQDPINPIKDDSGTIVLEPAELKGMFAGGGPAMGGFLG